MRVLEALVVAAALPCFAFSQKSCEDAGGKCVKPDNTTDGCAALTVHNCPDTSHVCCPTGEQSSFSIPPTGEQSSFSITPTGEQSSLSITPTASSGVRFADSKGWKCQASRKCTEKGGKCVSKGELSSCPTSSYKIKNFCNSYSCVCCIEKREKCETSSKCLAKGGFCISTANANECAGHVEKGFCEGEKCACCIPDSVACSPLPKCKSHHGSCIAKKDKHTCKGVIIKKGCHNKDCVCCVPEKTSSSGCKCGIINGHRIVGGVQVEPPNKYPWVVGLKVTRNSSYFCGGNIINDRYILTVANCFFNFTSLERIPVSDIEVGIADHDQFSTTDDVPGVTRQVGVEEIIIFKKFNIQSLDFDIALLKLKEPLDLTKREVGPICLPQNDDQTYGGFKGTTVGWGRTSENDTTLPAILREVVVPILKKETCESMTIASLPITERMICAGLPEGGKDACFVDGGGPLCVVEEKRHVLVGLTSFGEGCARPGIPGVYTRVSKFLDWIRKNTKDAMFCM